MGHPVQIVRPNIDGGFLLDTHALGEILLADNVKDKSAVVISVTGPSRTGKSFLLNLLLWLLIGDLDVRSFNAFIREGFPWKRGTRPNTAGIWLWSEVFLVKRPQGGEVAVLLMDSQGLFGLETRYEDSLSISAFCALISSVMVYNVAGAIRQTDLVHLEQAQYQAFLGKVKLGEEIPPPKLFFLLRDCPHERTIPYGEKGGDMILNELLKTSSGLSSDIEMMCGNIFSYFSEIGCFRMPHPGLKLLKLAANEVLPLHLEDGFTNSAYELLHSLFAPDNLLEKQRFGKTINCGHLFYFVKEIFDAVNTKGIHASSTMPTMAQEDCVVARKARYRYVDRMEKVCGAHYSEVHASELTIAACKLGEEDPDQINGPLILVHSELFMTLQARPHQELETSRRTQTRTSESFLQDSYCDSEKNSEGLYSDKSHTEALHQQQKEEQRESSLRFRRKHLVKQPHTPEGISTAGSTSSWL